MSQPTFVPERREIWFTDGTSGFYALRVAPSAWPASETVRCASRRLFTIHLREPRGGSLRSAA